ncbi:MAG: lysophospholipid acyltransferase family protein [Rhodocyclaceae bacterium]
MWRGIRAFFRLARVGMHLAWGAATVAVVYPWIDVRPRRALKRRWSRQLLEMLGVRLELGTGRSAPPAGLIVCNHISWLDVFVINAAVPAAFVCKSEVMSWPLIGWLCRHTETIFLERGSRTAAQKTRRAICDELRAGVHVAVFPEGTTTTGERVLPFHAAVFQSAIDARSVVIPVALRYIGRRGDISRAPAYVGDVTLWRTLWAIACAEGLIADLRILAPVASEARERRELAADCHAAIVWHIGNQGFATPAVETAGTTEASEIFMPAFAEEP